MLSCPFHILTGLNCPFCGAQRMVLALLDGDVASAFWLNPGLAIGAPLVGAWWLWRGQLSPRAAFILLCMTFAWGILRNLCHIGL